MATLRIHFQELLENLRPPEERLKAAVEWPAKVRQYLEENDSFNTVAPHSRLVGSYAQKLSVGDVKDVDFLVRVPGNPEDNDPEAKQLIKELKTALDGLPEYLGYNSGYTDIQTVNIERARRSVHVYFEGPDFHLDVVPCIAPEGFEKPIWVPDRGFNEWIASHPVGVVNLLNELNNKHSHNVKKLGRLLKHFRNVQMKNRKPKSYWLVALLIHHITRPDGLDMTRSLDELFSELLRMIYAQYASLLPRTDGATPNIKDPILGHNVSWNWSRTHFETFMRRLDDGHRWAEEALEEMAKERVEIAIQKWQKVFGEEYFPANVEKSIAKMAAAALPGVSYVTASGLVVASPTTSVRSTPTQETKFYGEEEF